MNKINIEKAKKLRENASPEYSTFHRHVVHCFGLMYNLVRFNRRGASYSSTTKKLLQEDLERLNIFFDSVKVIIESEEFKDLFRWMQKKYPDPEDYRYIRPCVMLRRSFNQDMDNAKLIALHALIKESGMPNYTDISCASIDGAEWPKDRIYVFIGRLIYDYLSAFSQDDSLFDVFSNENLTKGLSYDEAKEYVSGDYPNEGKVLEFIHLFSEEVPDNQSIMDFLKCWGMPSAFWGALLNELDLFETLEEFDHSDVIEWLVGLDDMDMGIFFPVL